MVSASTFAPVARDRFSWHPPGGTLYHGTTFDFGQFDEQKSISGASAVFLAPEYGNAARYGQDAPYTHYVLSVDVEGDPEFPYVPRSRSEKQQAYEVRAAGIARELAVEAVWLDHNVDALGMSREEYRTVPRGELMVLDPEILTVTRRIAREPGERAYREAPYVEREQIAPTVTASERRDFPGIWMVYVDGRGEYFKTEGDALAVRAAAESRMDAGEFVKATSEASVTGDAERLNELLDGSAQATGDDEMPNGGYPHDDYYPGAPYPRTMKAVKFQGGMSRGVVDMPVTGDGSNYGEPYYGTGVDSGGDEKIDILERGGKSYCIYRRPDDSYYAAQLDMYGNAVDRQDAMSGTMNAAYSWIDDNEQENMALTDSTAGSPPDTSMDNQLEEVFEEAGGMVGNNNNDTDSMDMDMDMGRDRNQGIADAMMDYKDGMDYGQGMDSGGGMGMDRSSMEYRGMPNRPMYRSRGGRGRMRY